MDLIDKVSEIREGYRHLLVDASSQKDPLLEEEAVFGARERYGDDAVVNMTMVWVLTAKVEPEPNISHLIIAVQMLDYLDTLGMELRHKK